MAAHAAAEGGNTAGFIENGDWISYTPYLLNNATQFTARVSSAGAGGTIEVRAGSADRHAARHRHRGPDRQLGDVRQRHREHLRRARTGRPRCTWCSRAAAGNLFDVDAFTFTTGTTSTGPTVSLRSLTNNLYVSAPNATTALIANSATIGTAQQFELVDLGGGKVALRSKANGQFVCAENGGANPLLGQPAHGRLVGDVQPDPQRRRQREPAGDGEQPVRHRGEQRRRLAHREPCGDRPLGEVRTRRSLMLLENVRSDVPPVRDIDE